MLVKEPLKVNDQNNKTALVINNLRQLYSPITPSLFPFAHDTIYISCHSHKDKDHYVQP